MKKALYHFLLLTTLTNAAYAVTISHDQTNLHHSPAIEALNSSDQYPLISETWFFKTFHPPYDIKRDRKNNILYLAVKHTLLALNAESGELLWSLYGNFVLSKMHGDNLLVRQDSELILLDKTGKKQWSRPLPELRSYYPSDQRILVHEHYKGITAIDWQGAELWKKEYSFGGDWLARAKSVYLFGGWIKGDNNTNLTSIDPQTGETQWQVNLDRPEAKYGNFVDYVEVSNNGTLYVVTRPTDKVNRLYSISADGKINWETQIPDTYRPMIMYVDDKVFAILIEMVRQKPGYILYTSDDLKTQTKYQLPAYVKKYKYIENNLYIYTDNHVLHALDKFGKHLWQTHEVPKYDCMNLVNNFLAVSYRDEKNNYKSNIEFFDRNTGVSKGIYRTNKSFTWCSISNEKLTYITEQGYGEFSIKDRR